MATATDVQNLKEQWKSDPIWDLEHTEGFENHFNELKSYREEWEGIWKSKRNDELIERSKKMGIPNNLDLVKYLEGMEFKIERLEDEVARLIRALEEK